MDRNSAGRKPLPLAKWDVFISYAREDEAFTNKLEEALAGADRKVWVDLGSIPKAAKFEEEIRRGIQASDAFLFVISTASVTSSICKDEIEYAKQLNKRLFPILHGQVEASEIHPALREINWINVREDNLKEGLSQLMQALDTDLPWVRESTRLLVRSIEWDEKGRDFSFALQGRDLENAERWLANAGAGKERNPTSLQTDYILSSRKESDRRKRRALVVLSSLSVATTALAIVAIILFLIAENRRKISSSRALAAQALNIEDNDFGLALLLSSEAYRTADTFQASQSLYRSLTTHPFLSAFLNTDSVSCVAFSPDGKFLASCLEQGPILVWDVSERRQIANLDGQEAKNLAFSPDGRILVSVSPENGMIFWDTQSWGLKREFVGAKGAVSISFSPDGKTLASASPKSGIILWNCTANPTVGSQLDDLGARIVVFSPDGKTLAAASGNKCVLYEVGTGQRFGEPLAGKDPDAEMESLAFSPDSKLLASGGWDKTVTVWNVADQKMLHQLPYSTVISSLAFGQDGKTLLSGGWDNNIVVWDWEHIDNERLRVMTVLAGHRTPISCLAFTRDGKTWHRVKCFTESSCGI